MIIENFKQPLPDDPTPSEAPPSYDTVIPVDRVFPSTSKAIDQSSEPRSPQLLSSTPVSPAIKSPLSSAKGKARAGGSWFSFGSSKTTREVRSTVQGLVRDLVREHSDSGASVGILESCAEACAGYSLSLSSVLQEKFIEDHTPLYWAIVKRRPDGDSSDPPDLLTALISFASPLVPETIADVRHACLLTSDQPLFQRLRMSPEFSPLSGTDEMLLDATMPPDNITVEHVSEDEGQFAVNFDIVHFRKRMFVSKHIELDFIARSRMWRLEFLIAQETRFHGPKPGTWCISLSLLENSPPTYIDSRLLIPEPNPNKSPSGFFDASKYKPKPTISIRIRSAQQLVAPPIPRPRHGQVSGVVVSLEDSLMANNLQYAETSYIAPDGTLRARLEARIGKSAISDAECNLC